MSEPGAAALVRPTAAAESDHAAPAQPPVRSLLDQRVVSQSEFDQRRTQFESARQQYEAARNGASQQFQALQAARARVALARKSVADTVVRAPFAGLVGERLVSVGDYVTKGTNVAVVVRVNPLRVQLTIPEQFVSAVAVGAEVVFQVDAYPGREFTGTVRSVSPALEANRRAAQFLQTFVTYPPSQIPASFTIDQTVEDVKAKVKAAIQRQQQQAQASQKK